MRRRTTTVLGLVAATSLLTACGSGATDAGVEPAPDTDSAGATTTPSPSDAADPKDPEFPSGTGQQLARQEGAWDLVLRDVRVGRHDGFDRVVAEFKGTGTPGWATHYVTTPRAEGSGEVVDVGGDSYLGVGISGVTFRQGYPQAPEDYFRGARHFAPRHTGSIEDVNVVGVNEGYSQVFLGIDGDEVPFRVFALTNPSRLVVDVTDD